MHHVRSIVSVLLLLSFTLPATADDRSQWRAGRRMQWFGGIVAAIGTAAYVLIDRAADNARQEQGSDKEKISDRENSYKVGAVTVGWLGLVTFITGSILRSTSDYYAGLDALEHVAVTQIGNAPALVWQTSY